MQFSCDRTGFPLLELPELELAVSLLPVTKVQFEQFLAEPDGYSNLWYEEVLQVNPRISWRTCSNKEREKVFISGIYPIEALDYIEWLGEDFDLPTGQEWQDMAKLLMSKPISKKEIQHLVRDSAFHPVSRTLIRKLNNWIHPQFWVELGLWKNGLAELVRSGTNFKVSGVPRQEFYPNTWDLFIEPRRLLVESRIKCVGFRPVKRLSKDWEEDE